MVFLIKFMMRTNMIKIIFIFLFIITATYSQDTNYYWNDVGISLHQLFVKMDTPTDIEYQEKSGVYWMAYDFGDAAVIYIISKGFVSSVIYMKNNRSYDDIHDTFLKLWKASTSDEFFTSEYNDGTGHYNQIKNDIKMTSNISIVNTEFVLTILVTKMKK